MLETVVGLFWRHGYTGTSMADIEAATGLKRTSLYNYFGSKDDLIAAALAMYVKLVSERVTDPLLNGSAGLDDLDAFFSHLGAMATAPGSPDGCLVLSYIEELASIERFVDTPREHVERFNASLTGALDRAAALGEIPASSVERRARLLEAAVIGINVTQPAFEGDDATRAAIEAIREEIKDWRQG